MDNVYSEQRRVGIRSWSWLVGITVLFVTLFIPPPLPVSADLWWGLGYIIKGGGSFWHVFDSIPPHFLQYYLTHYLRDVFFKDLLPMCGFPVIWSMVSVGMWGWIVNKGRRSTIIKGMLALFLADVLAWLISVVVLGRIIWMVSPKEIIADSPVIIPTLITEGIITIQAVLYLPLILLVGALLAKLQARAWPAPQ